jgi:hypothetical protein
MKAPEQAGKSSPPVTFQAGPHEVRVWMANGRWSVAVDDAVLTQWFMSQVDAWAAGVSEAARLDKAVR